MPLKNIEPQLCSISEYTSLGKNDIFEIPEYQRAYSWTLEQCDKLWQDIETFIASNAEDPYFFGTIIVDCSTPHHLSIIDGQQRTTTFLLLLRAIQLRLKDVLDNFQEDKETRALHLGLNNSYNTLFRILYKADEEQQVEIMQSWDVARGITLIENNSINEEFKNDLRAIIEAESFEEAERNVHKFTRKQKDNKYTNYFRNFKYFYGKLSQYGEAKLNTFVKIFLSKCQIIEIKSWQIEQAITMFNSLNSTGQPLNDADIISARLYSFAIDENKEAYSEAWKQIKELSTALEQRKLVNLDGALQQYMYITRAKEKYYKVNEVTTPGLRKFYLTEHPEILNTPVELCNSLLKILLIWDTIKDYPIIKLLMKFNENFKLFIISYLYRFDVKELNEKIVEPIAECMLRLFAIIESGDSSFSASKFKTFLFNENLNLVKPEYPLANIIDDFNHHISTTWNQEDVADDLRHYEKNVLVYLNEYLYAKEQNRNFDINDRTNVEHIMPASGHNHESIRDDAKVDEEGFSALVNQLGNKILLEETINKAIGNDWFRTKKGNTIQSRNGYVGSRFGFALDLAKWSKDRWEKADIEAATEAAVRRISRFIFDNA